MDLTTCACGRVLLTDQDLKRGVCFGCHAKGLMLVVPRRMSWQNEDAQAEHMAEAKKLMAKNPDRYAPAGSRWV